MFYHHWGCTVQQFTVCFPIPYILLNPNFPYLFDGWILLKTHETKFAYFLFFINRNGYIFIILLLSKNLIITFFLSHICIRIPIIFINILYHIYLYITMAQCLSVFLLYKIQGGAPLGSTEK